jgi:hypothetical protein
MRGFVSLIVSLFVTGGEQIPSMEVLQSPQEIGFLEGAR